jgi:hypothetical protein
VKLGADVITIRRAPEVINPRDGTRERDWDNATEVTYRNCNVQPFLLTDKLKIERAGEREFVDDTWRVWGPVGMDVLYTDRAVFKGVEYEVRGLTGEWRDLDGKDSHVNFMLRRRVG